ncbi:hypothetical protein SLT36_31205 (plasmid) [Aminobacter sp. BA135]|uniref:hypothetical protein n=1 Tax=Aminobacter sp. BA135 TaxID=537596 RepID=UPI003D7A952F
MLINGKTVDLNCPATFYEDRFTHGTFFAHLAQAIRHAVATPSSRQMHSASIVTQSGDQFGWAEISLLHDHLHNDAATSAAKTDAARNRAGRNDAGENDAGQSGRGR